MQTQTERKKTIGVLESTHSELESLGKKGDSFDTIIQRLIATYKEANGLEEIK